MNKCFSLKRYLSLKIIEMEKRSCNRRMIEQMVHPHDGILYSSIIYNEGYLPVKTHKKEVSQILNIV